MQVVGGIHLVPAPSHTFAGTYAPNVYLVGLEKLALVDSGWGNSAAIEARLDYVRGLGCSRLKYIILTHSHPDHRGGAQRIQAATGARILVHPLQIQGDDKPIEDGAVVELEEFRLTIIHTPGHSRDSLCVLAQPGDVLFSGDSILGLGTTVVVPPDGDMADYVDSLKKLQAYDIKMICPGHGPVIREPRHKLEEREEQILKALSEGCTSLESLADYIYPELTPRLQGMARWQVESHLHKLVKEGKVSWGGGEYWSVAKS